MWEFNREKAIEVILYIVHNVKEPTFHKISKMLYFADKLHLEKYGRFICGDYYVAMEYGPVPSGVYDIMKSDGIVFHDAFDVEGYLIIPTRSCNDDELSESDIMCLDEAIKTYGQLSFGKLVDITHQESAYKEAPINGEMTIESIIKMLESSEDLLEYIEDPTP